MRPCLIARPPSLIDVYWDGFREPFGGLHLYLFCDVLGFGLADRIYETRDLWEQTDEGVVKKPLGGWGGVSVGGCVFYFYILDAFRVEGEAFFLILMYFFPLLRLFILS